MTNINPPIEQTIKDFGLDKLTSPSQTFETPEASGFDRVTPDTEWEKAELAVFWDEIAQHLPKSIERSALGDEKIFRAFATAYPKMKKHLISSRDTYWKERVREEVEYILDSHIEMAKHSLKNAVADQVSPYKHQLGRLLQAKEEILDTLLDNLK